MISTTSHGKRRHLQPTCARSRLRSHAYSRRGGSQQPGNVPSAFKTVQDSIIACEVDLKALWAFINEFSGSTGVSHPDFADKCREHYRKVKYGFKQSKKTEIEGLMTTINSTLLVGLGALGL